MASPIPVFPLVASTTVCPGFSFPVRSASSITPRASRSFTDPSGLNASTFTYRFTSGGASRLIRTTGVLPTVFVMFANLLIPLTSECRQLYRCDSAHLPENDKPGGGGCAVFCGRSLHFAPLSVRLRAPRRWQGFFSGQIVRLWSPRPVLFRMATFWSRFCWLSELEPLHGHARQHRSGFFQDPLDDAQPEASAEHQDREVHPPAGGGEIAAQRAPEDSRKPGEYGPYRRAAGQGGEGAAAHLRVIDAGQRHHLFLVEHDRDGHGLE